jgi:hypothetical protein
MKALLGNNVPEAFSATFHAEKAMDNTTKRSIIQEHNPLIM